MENWTVKSVDGVEAEASSAQEKEQAVLDKAVEQGDIAPEAANAEPDVIKVDLDEPPKQEQDAVQQVQGETEEGVLRDEGVEPPSQEEVPNEAETQSEEAPVIELIQDEETDTNEGGVAEESKSSAPPQEQEEVLQEAQAQLPEGMENLIKFMDETGGSLEDYVNLNKSYDDMHPVDVIKEYYKSKYPHYNEDRLQRRMNKDFSYDEADDPDVIQDKKDLFEDTVFEAKKFLNDKKGKYYNELKFNREKDIAPEYKEASDFYSEYKKGQEENEKLVQAFQQKTDNLFNDEFKGFDFKVGESKYRFRVSDVKATKDYQSDLNNFIGEFAGEDGSISDVAGYHKALFAAKNADKIAQHFYEQGRADAIKKSAAEAKNIDMKPRGDAASTVTTKSGTQVRVVSGDSSNGLRFKMRK